jgi:hypothetical protein
MPQSDPEPAELAEKTIDDAEAKVDYFKPCGRGCQN